MLATGAEGENRPAGARGPGRGKAGGQEHVTMTAKPADSPVTEAVRSLEVRWIFPGQLEAAVAGWFGRFPARVESREDIYLLDPRLPGLMSVQPSSTSPVAFLLGSWRPGSLGALRMGLDSGLWCAGCCCFQHFMSSRESGFCCCSKCNSPAAFTPS